MNKVQLPQQQKDFGRQLNNNQKCKHKLGRHHTAVLLDKNYQTVCSVFTANTDPIMFCVHGEHINAGKNFQEIRIEAHATVTMDILLSFPGIHSMTQGISRCADGL